MRIKHLAAVAALVWWLAYLTRSSEAFELVTALAFTATAAALFCHRPPS